ncbi:MAG: hypothetical protein WA728_00005 [Xanthobacteraceae bacterium]
MDELHESLIDRVVDDFFARTKKVTGNPIGQVVLGEAGAGKTHLIGTLRRRVWQANGWFVLLDIIGITDFWATAALGFLNSLHQSMSDGRTQYEAVLSAIVKSVPHDAATGKAIAEWEKKREKTDLDKIALFLKLLWRATATVVRSAGLLLDTRIAGMGRISGRVDISRRQSL